MPLVERYCLGRQQWRHAPQLLWPAIFPATNIHLCSGSAILAASLDVTWNIRLDTDRVTAPFLRLRWNVTDPIRFFLLAGHCAQLLRQTGGGNRDYPTAGTRGQHLHRLVRSRQGINRPANGTANLNPRGRTGHNVNRHVRAIAFDYRLADSVPSIFIQPVSSRKKKNNLLFRFRGATGSAPLL